jgi:hypothetical protein
MAQRGRPKNPNTGIVRNNYPEVRQKRTTYERSDGTVYQTKQRAEMQEMQLKLMSYAPPHSFLYTITYNKTRASRYQYCDVFVINNGRLFKITKIVAYILGFRIYKPRKTVFWGKDCMVVRTFREYKVFTKYEMIDIEYDFIRILSKKLFGIEDAYNHQSLLLMESQFDKKLEEVEPQRKKSFIVKSGENF